MKKIVSDIHNAEQNSRKTVEFLTQNSSFNWVGNYPIALVNEKSRIEDEESLKKLEEIDFFNEEGFSKASYTQEEIEHVIQNIPTAIKTTYCLCLKNRPTSTYSFKEKFSHDRWKKITDEDNFEAFVESSKFHDEDKSKDIETALRDIMRSAKEIPALKKIGFVWIVTVAQTTTITDILEHYFFDNYIYIEKGRKVTYIAWADTLSDINMRYFVNIP